MKHERRNFRHSSFVIRHFFRRNSLQFLNHFLQRQPVGVDRYGIRRAGSNGPTARVASSRSRRLLRGNTCSSVTGSPCDCKSNNRRRARSAGLAVRKILHSAWGKRDRPLIAPFRHHVVVAGQLR